MREGREGREGGRKEEEGGRGRGQRQRKQSKHCKKQEDVGPLGNVLLVMSIAKDGKRYRAILNYT